MKIKQISKDGRIYVFENPYVKVSFWPVLKSLQDDIEVFGEYEMRRRVNQEFEMQEEYVKKLDAQFNAAADIKLEFFDYDRFRKVWQPAIEKLGELYIKRELLKPHVSMLLKTLG